MKKSSNFILLSACAFALHLSRASAILCPAITVADYNEMPHLGANPRRLTIAGSVWELGGPQGRAQHATAFSPAVSPNSAVCTYNQHQQCCTYTATIGGINMPREFHFVKRVN